jgi:hypothetical protein
MARLLTRGQTKHSARKPTACKRSSKRRVLPPLWWNGLFRHSQDADARQQDGTHGADRRKIRIRAGRHCAPFKRARGPMVPCSFAILEVGRWGVAYKATRRLPIEFQTRQIFAIAFWTCLGTVCRLARISRPMKIRTGNANPESRRPNNGQYCCRRTYA